MSYDVDTKKLNYDLINYSPAPGVRLFQFNAITDGEDETSDKEVSITQPFVIYPEDYDEDTDNAPTTIALPIECIADNEYPKIIGEI